LKIKFVEDREYELIQIIRIQYFDSPDAKGKLLDYHKGLVFSLAGKFIRLFPAETIEDIAQDLRIFLLVCATKYDPLDLHHAKFSTYYRRAVFLNAWDLLNEKVSLIAIPRHIRAEAAKISKIRKELLVIQGEPATDEQIFEKAGISPELGESFKKIFHVAFISLDSPIGHEDDRTLEDIICDTVDQENISLQRIFNKEISEIILTALNGTNPTIKVFVQKFLSGMPLEQIVDELKLSDQEVERIWRLLRIQFGQDKSLLELKKTLSLA
jgi:RNA polymerase sigma factor (sigma-70 family)